MFTLIVNPVAGNGHALAVEKQLRAWLEGRQEKWELLHTEYAGHATELARRAAQSPECQGVIAVGGDGTLYETACGLMGTNVPLGIVPADTGNDFMKTAALPKKPLDALEFIFSHKPRAVDVGKLNERIFLNVCGTGFDVTVLDYTLAAKKYMRGIFPYLVGLVRAVLHYHPVHLSYTVDGKQQERSVLICSVANGRFIGGGIPICPEARPDDGLLDVVIVETRPRWKIPFYLPGLLLGRITHFGITAHVRCSSVSIASTGMRLNVDGEIFSMDRADFSIQPGGLMLFW